MGGACSVHGEIRYAYKILDRKEGRRPLGRPRSRWDDKIKMAINNLFGIELGSPDSG
jgi:hypothetical protein